MSKRLLHIAAATATALVLAGCAASGPSASSDDSGDPELGTEGNPVRLGIVNASEPYWEVYEQAVIDAGIEIELVEFAEYPLPNPALTEGDLDANQFQHIQYLADYNVSADEDLQPIGATAIYPLGLYSDKYDSVDDIPEGEEVLVPNDTVNQARGLLVLQSAGLIELEDGGNASSTLDDIDEDNSRVTVRAVDASLTVTSLPDVAAAIVNNDFLTDAGLAPEDAIATDDPADPNSLPYVNIFVTRADDVDNEVLNQLVEIYQTTQSVQDGVLEASGGTAVLLQTPAADLQESLAETEDAIRGE